MRDPVLERNMFRKTEAEPSSEGVVSLVKEESDYERRKKQAMEMLAVAKERQNPENYKTLSEQNRPGVFRPVATGQPQAPQPNTQQQLAQMQAMGFRPVGMRDGGYVQHFANGSGPEGVRPTIAAGPNALYTMPDIGLRIGRGDQPGITFASQQNYVRPQFVPESMTEEERVALELLKNRYGEEEAQKIFDEQSARYSGEEGSILGRFVRRLFGDNPPDKAEIEQTLKTIREQEGEKPRPGVSQREQDRLLADIEAKRRITAKAQRETPLPGLLDPSSEEEVNKILEERKKRERQALTEAGFSDSQQEEKGEPQFTATAQEGIRTIPSAYNRTPVPKSYASSSLYAPKKTEQEKPKKDVPLTDMEAIKRERERQRAADRQDDILMALMQAGLAMAAGQSPNALTNIATGGISGLQAFSELQKGRRASDLAERELAMKEDYYSGKKDRETLANMIDRERNRDQKAKLIYEIRSKAVEQVRKEAEDNAALKTDPIQYNLRIEELTKQWLSSLDGYELGGVGETPNINLNAIKSNPEFEGFQ